MPRITFISFFDDQLPFHQTWTSVYKVLKRFIEFLPDSGRTREENPTRRGFVLTPHLCATLRIKRFFLSNIYRSQQVRSWFFLCGGHIPLPPKNKSHKSGLKPIKCLDEYYNMSKFITRMVWSCRYPISTISFLLWFQVSFLKNALMTSSIGWHFESIKSSLCVLNHWKMPPSLEKKSQKFFVCFEVFSKKFDTFSCRISLLWISRSPIWRIVGSKQGPIPVLWKRENCRLTMSDTIIFSELLMDINGSCH